MATAQPIPDSTAPPPRSSATVLVLIPAMPMERLEALLSNLTASLPAESLLIATPDTPPSGSDPALRIIPAPSGSSSWILTAENFMNAHQLAQTNEAHAILMLGSRSDSLRASVLYDLANAVLSDAVDLAVPCYVLPPNAGLINSAILYPLSRALFVSRTRFPLAIDLGLSPRMAGRLATAAQRFISLNQGDAPLWPINEAAIAGFTPREFEAGMRDIPQPHEPDLNSILPLLTGSLFSDIDAKAPFWQRPRPSPPVRSPILPTLARDAAADIAPMIESFHLAHTNLQEIWSLILPPNSLLGLKRLSVAGAEAFRMPDSLWARIVYDFLLAYRLRTINRGHLLGALIPLYLAWVASHINITASGTNAESHIEAVAAAFEADKPYLVSRWRWPDRFSP